MHTLTAVQNAMKPLLRTLADFLILRFDLERKSIVTAMAWGLWVIVRRSFESGDSYLFLKISAGWFGMGGEWFWGGLLLLGGTLQVTGLVTKRDGLRMAAAMLLSAVWLLIGVQFTLHNDRSTAVPAYLAFAWSAGVLYFQIGTARR